MHELRGRHLPAFFTWARLLCPLDALQQQNSALVGCLRSDFIRLYQSACLPKVVLHSPQPHPNPQPTLQPCSPFKLMPSSLIADLLCCNVGLHDQPPLCLLDRQHPDRLRGDGAGVSKQIDCNGGMISFARLRECGVW